MKPFAVTPLVRLPSPLLSTTSANTLPFSLLRPCTLLAYENSQSDPCLPNQRRQVKRPRHPQGKHNSSRNSTRHGMFADTIVLETEDKRQFLEMLEDLFAEHQPRTRTESMLVEVLAATRWRQDRIFGMQAVAFDYDVSTCTADTELNPLRAVLQMRTPESARSHELLLRYEIALDRQVSRTLLRLHQLQDRRAKSEALTAGEPIATPSVLRDPKKTPPGKRTQQPIESVTRPPSASAQIPRNPTPKNPPSPSVSTSPTPSRTEKPLPLPVTGQKLGPVRKKPAA